VGDKKGDVSQIGKFGVGFYSSFMVSDQVVVKSKKFNSEQGYIWMSDGKGSYSIEKTEVASHGTETTKPFATIATILTRLSRAAATLG
jgi:molecular chaperone HtpG